MAAGGFILEDISRACGAQNVLLMCYYYLLTKFTRLQDVRS